ncbi:hypothetical protein EVAR_81197_1 [Eumeta japonica]|uniref:Uncharacterized protein n=1 Tax=Eumeta variegata TaxID=151549 RepID=A0A4C1V1I7_EUMVA|nr:hypothetical protein EVAR_81197_1 [Eumeta japonica]
MSPHEFYFRNASCTYAVTSDIDIRTTADASHSGPSDAAPVTAWLGINVKKYDICLDGTASNQEQIFGAGLSQFDWFKIDPSEWSLFEGRIRKLQKIV